jgi:hypothetical protein
MSRRRYRFIDGELVEIPLDAPARAQNTGPAVISDNLDYMVSMADGKRYTSKAKYRAELKARGYTEVGNERMPDIPRPQSRGVEMDIKRAIHEVMNR